MTKRILAIGGAHVDWRAHLTGTLVPEASNPAVWSRAAGGGVFNAARWLARFGHDVRLIAPRGGDAAGDLIAGAAADAGIDDTPLVFLDRTSASYTSVLDGDGNLVIGLADTGLYDLFGPRQIQRRTVRDAIAACDLVLTDANLPEATLSALAGECRATGTPLSAIAISPARVVRLSGALPTLDWLFMNAAEALAIAGRKADSPAGWATLLGAAGLRRGVVTAGAAQAVAFDAHACHAIAPPSVGPLVDVTGAGDALAAAFIDATVRGADTAAALRLGVAAATLAVGSHLPVPPAVDRAAVESALSAVAPAVRVA